MQALAESQRQLASPSRHMVAALMALWMIALQGHQQALHTHYEDSQRFQPRRMMSVQRL